MNDILRDLFADEVTIVAYRVCNIIKFQKEHEEPLKERLYNYWALGFKLARQVNQPEMKKNKEFSYVELISSADEVFYIYDNVKAYEEYSGLSICENLGIFKNDDKKVLISSADNVGPNEEVTYLCDGDLNVNSMWKTKKKTYYRRVYPVEQLIKELEGKIYRLKDGNFGYEKGSFVTEGLSITPYGNIKDNTQKYKINTENHFVQCLKNKLPHIHIKDRDMWLDYWRKIDDSIRLSSKLVDDLGVDFSKMRNEYKSAIDILEKKKLEQ